MLNKLVQNIVTYGFINGIKSLVPFIMLPILTTNLSVEEFGLLSIIEVSLLFLFPFISLNISAAINVEYFHIGKKNFILYFNNAIGLSLGVFIFFTLMVVIYVENIQAYIKLNSMLIILLPLFAFLRLLPQVLLGLFQVQQKVKNFALFSITQTIFDFSLSYILVVVYTKGYMGRLEGIYIASTVMTLCAIVYLYKNNFLRQLTWQYTNRIINFSIPLIPHVLGGIIIAMSDRYFIMYYMSTEDVAYYTVAYQVASLMLLFSISLNQAWGPILFRWLKEGNKLSLIVQYTFVFILLFGILGYFIYSLEEILFELFINKIFYNAKQYFVWLLIGFVFQSFYFLVTHFLFFKKKTRILAVITFLGAILNLVLNYFFIQTDGIMGVAYATAITWSIFFCIVSCINIYIYRKDIQ